jgi:hypothetical protein
MAESQYGYDTATGNTVTAKARVNVTVNVPKLILFRVGSDNTTIDTVTISATPSIPAVPTTPVVGNNTNVSWSGAAPTFTGSASGNVLAVSAWTNSSGGGSVGCAVTTTFPAASGLAGSNITVGSGAGLAHPGTDTSCPVATTTTFAKNTAVSGTWTYGINAAGLTALASAPAGSYTETVTYTATSL